jgi:nitrite reductase/ring-hydroxylating ferredoxin subunit
MHRIRLAATHDVPGGTTLKFRFPRQGRTVDGFLACFKGKFVAYENVCRHLPLTLDYGDNRFFTDDGRHFACQTHAAIYEPRSGLCVRGPCLGARLMRLPIKVLQGSVWLLLESEVDAVRRTPRARPPGFRRR